MFDTKSPTDYVELLGARLRALRLQRNMTQDQLASRAGISRPTLSNFERTGRGTVESLCRLMYALGRESELEGLLQPDPPSTLDDVAATPARQRARPDRGGIE